MGQSCVWDAKGVDSPGPLSTLHCTHTPSSHSQPLGPQNTLAPASLPLCLHQPLLPRLLVGPTSFNTSLDMCFLEPGPG